MRAVAAALLIALAGAASAQDPALSARIDAYDEALRSGSLAGMLSFSPPAMLDALADRGGLTRQQLVERAEAMTGTMLEGVDLDALRFDMGLATAEYGESADGRPYAVMLSELVMPPLPAFRKPVVALKDDGRWYLVRIESDTHMDLLTEVYPDLEGLELPE